MSRGERTDVLSYLGNGCRISVTKHTVDTALWVPQLMRVPKVGILVEHASRRKKKHNKMETVVSDETVQGQELMGLPKVPENM